MSFFGEAQQKVFEPYLITKKISVVAYRLDLPLGSFVHLMFHISLLKPFVRDRNIVDRLELPTLTIDAHPVAIPLRVIAYRVVKIKGR